MSRTFRSLSPLYDFANGDEVTLPVPPAVKPLPENLLTANQWDIPASGRLIELQTTLDSAAAFERWAQELLGLYEYAWSRPTVPDLDACVAVVDAVWAESEPEATTPEWHAYHSRCRAALMPFYEAGLTLREIAELCALSLHDVARVLLSRRTSPEHAERVSALEHALLGGVLERKGYRELKAEFGTSSDTITKLCDRLGVPRRKRVPASLQNVAA